MHSMRHNSRTVIATKNRRVSYSAIAAGALLLAVSFTATGHAQSTGVAACDDFLEKYTTCVTSKLPATAKPGYQAQLDQMRKTWVDLAKQPGAKSAMEASCKQTMDTMKTALSSYGCSF
jgi:hypothetical protein